MRRRRPLPSVWVLHEAVRYAPAALTPETRAVLPVLRDAARARLRARLLETVEAERQAALPALRGQA